MKELTRPYILRVTVGFGIRDTGERYDICKVEQVRNRKVAQPTKVYDRTGYYWKSLKALIRDDFTGYWDKDCHLFVYNTNDFTYCEGILYD